MVDRADAGSDRGLLWREFKLLAVLAAVLALGAVVVLATGVLLLIFGGILLAVLLHGPSAWLCRHTPLSLRGAVAVIAIVALAVLVGGGLLAMPPMVDQATQFVERVPEALNALDERVAGLLGVEGLSLTPVLPAAQSFVGTIPNIVMTTFGAFAGIVIVVAVGLYLAADPPVYRDGFVRLFVPRQRGFVLATLNEAGEALQRWMYGQFIAMVIVGIVAYVVLRLLGVPLAFGLAVLTALLDFVPYIGAIAAAVPVVLIAFGESPQLALYALAAYMGIQMAEGYLLVPVIQKRAIYVPPGAIIASQVLLGVLFGVIGIVLATPLCAVATVLIRRCYVEAVLESRAEQDREAHKQAA